MKAKILNPARRLFGEYGFHGVTTRVMAKDVGIDTRPCTTIGGTNKIYTMQ